MKTMLKKQLSLDGNHQQSNIVHSQSSRKHSPYKKAVTIDIYTTDLHNYYDLKEGAEKQRMRSDMARILVEHKYEGDFFYMVFCAQTQAEPKESLAIRITRKLFLTQPRSLRIKGKDIMRDIFWELVQELQKQYFAMKNIKLKVREKKWCLTPNPDNNSEKDYYITMLHLKWLEQHFGVHDRTVWSPFSQQKPLLNYTERTREYFEKEILPGMRQKKIPE
jgi:hypothetical protein